MKHKRLWIAAASLVALVTLVFWATRHVVVSIALRSDVQVALDEPLALETRVVSPIAVDVDAEVTGKAKVTPFAVDVDQVLRVPLNLTLDVPLQAKVQVDEIIPVRTNVPIDMVLTERELDLSHLEIPIDDAIYVDDVIVVDVVVPIDSTATTVMGVEVPVKMNVPVKLRVPIKQKVRVRDKLVVGLKSFRVPFHVDLPVNADVPFKQELDVSGRARVPLRQVVAIPLKQRLDVSVPDAIPVEATVKGQANARITSPVRVSASLDEGVSAKIGTIHVDASEVGVERKGAKD